MDYRKELAKVTKELIGAVGYPVPVKAARLIIEFVDGVEYEILIGLEAAGPIPERAPASGSRGSSRSPRFVYFIQEHVSLAIKIGLSERPNDRLSSLQTAHAQTLVLLGAVRGDIRLEERLHQQFANYRLKGEWFSKDIAADVQAILAADGVPESEWDLAG